MYNKPLTSIDAVKHTVQNSYSEQDWLLIVLKGEGWVNDTVALTPAVRSTVATLELNELLIIVRREALAIATPTLDKVKITVDFRVPGYDGWFHTVESLKYPTEEDIRWQLVKLREYTGFDIVVPVADSTYIASLAEKLQQKNF